MFNKDKLIIYLIIIIPLIIGLFSYHFVISGFKFPKTDEEKKESIKKDIFNKTFFSFGNFKIAGWPLTHFLFYIILGFIFPNDFLFLTFWGILWEITECIIGYFQRPKNLENDPEFMYQQFWNGNAYDIIFNSAGFFLGKYLQYLFNIDIINLIISTGLLSSFSMTNLNNSSNLESSNIESRIDNINIISPNLENNIDISSNTPISNNISVNLDNITPLISPNNSPISLSPDVNSFSNISPDSLIN